MRSFGPHQRQRAEEAAGHFWLVLWTPPTPVCPIIWYAAGHFGSAGI